MILVRAEMGETLRARRLDLGLTLREVASRSSVSFGYLSEIERGTKEASSEVLVNLAAALDVPLSALLTSVAERVGRAEVADLAVSVSAA